MSGHRGQQYFSFRLQMLRLLLLQPLVLLPLLLHSLSERRHPVAQQKGNLYRCGCIQKRRHGWEKEDLQQHKKKIDVCRQHGSVFLPDAGFYQFGHP